MRHTLKILVILAGAVLIGPNSQVTHAQDRCFRCLTAQGGCTEFCGCHCDDGSTFYVLGCQSNGDLTYSCSSGILGHCTSAGECALPSCLPNGVFCNYDSDCCTNICGDNAKTCGVPSPLLINLRNNSSNYHLTAAENGVDFDIDADGDLDHVAWTEADSDVAFVVLDRDGNGRIDNGAELFGNATRLNNGSVAENGFDALLDLDGGPSISDGQIDARDPAYFAMRLWLDRNHNGISEPAELQTLEAAGVTTIFTAYADGKRVDRNGNAYRWIGEALVRRNERDVRRRIFDVLLTASARQSETAER